MARPTVENRELIYDEQIYPLMAQIVEICRTNRISMVASFHAPSDEDPDLFCSTARTANPDTPEVLKRMVGVLFPSRPQVVAMTARCAEPAGDKAGA